MPDVYRCDELAEMWRVKSANNAATNAFPTFRKRLKEAIEYDPRKLHRLIDVLWDEIEQERCESNQRRAALSPMSDAELERRIAEKRGRADR